MKTNYQNLPDELKSRGLFCLWRYEKVKGRLSKIPYSLSGNRAKSTDRNSFCDFISAVNAAPKYSGIGLGIFDGFCAVDIDHCVADGKLSELALDVINSMNSYTEYSPSGGRACELSSRRTALSTTSRRTTSTTTKSGWRFMCPAVRTSTSP